MKCALLVLAWFCFSPARALKPIHHYHDLVAGQGCAGYRDGEFATALFDHPLGLALSGDGSLLYVADQNNNRIRVIHLDEDNRVETLAGSGQEGALDGGLLDASFNHPAGLLFLSPNKLLVNDRGNRLLRMVDLKKKQVTTVGGTLKAGNKREGPAQEVNLDPIWNMVYEPSENSVYFSEPGINLLGKWDLNSGLISLPLGPQPAVRTPLALCIFQNRVCVSDWGPTTGIYLLDGTGNTLPGQAALAAKPLGEGKGIVALIALKDDLYGLQTSNSEIASTEPIVKLNPYRPVHLYSPWAFPLDIQDQFAEPLLNFDAQDPAGFVAETREERKFYVASSSLESVIDFKDYNFEHLFSGDTDDGPKGLTDFDYPLTKPPQTFRILIVSNSIPNWTHEVNNNNSMETKRLLTFPKKMELFLNTQAALNDIPIHFEVLVYRHKNGGALSLFTWPYYEVPDAVENFNADLTIFFVSAQAFLNYESIFERPSGSEGILVKNFDP
ncbi:MAG TPA: hypothetical protein VGR89_11280, partial [Puia sp.]|nr:hypothetical protein [Puia sp.]